MFSGSITWNQMLTVFTADYISHMIRYVGIAGVVFVLFYWLKQRRLRAMKIQVHYPPASDIRREIKDSALSLAIFSLVGVLVFVMYRMGWTRMYLRIDDHGWGYLVFSALALIVLHDAYFYWMHRLMHCKPLFKLAHLTHHRSHNPTPWAAFAFHPVEAVIEAGLFPIVCLFIPFHPLAVLGWLLYMTVMNVMGHCGFEIFPRGFVTHPLFFWHNTSTHHNMHHRFANYNYGLYFNIWDRLMGTNHPRYESEYDANKQREEQLVNSPATAKLD